MARILVKVEELPPRDGIGRIELTYRDSRLVMFDVQTTTGSHQHQGVEDFSETEIVTYRDAEERNRLLRIYSADIG